MDQKNPFGYPLDTYLGVLVVACVAGVIKHINSTRKINVAKFFIDVLTAGFMGVVTFWLLEAIPIRGPMSAVLIAAGGLMGNKAVLELEALYKAKIGFRKNVPEIDQEGEVP